MNILRFFCNSTIYTVIAFGSINSTQAFAIDLIESELIVEPV